MRLKQRRKDENGDLIEETKRFAGLLVGLLDTKRTVRDGLKTCSLAVSGGWGMDKAISRSDFKLQLSSYISFYYFDSFVINAYLLNYCDCIYGE